MYKGCARHAFKGERVKNHFATFFKKSVTKNGEKMLISKCKFFSFSVDHKFYINISETMSDTVTSMFRLLKPGVLQVAYPDRPLYVAQLAIKEAKLKDVKALSRYLSPVAQQFIAQLTATDDRGAGGESDYDD